jgi:osmoprotectant transport system substrate-binding protein
MNLKLGSGRFPMVIAMLLVAAAACDVIGAAAPASRGTLEVASINSPKSSLLAQIYGQALAHDGYTIDYHLSMGSRDVVVAAIESGQVDLYPGYASTELEYYNKNAGEASGYIGATMIVLNSRLAPVGLVALKPSPAADQYAFAVTAATQARYHLTKVSDLGPIAGRLAFGTGPSCPTQSFCLPGLSKTYGINFRAFRALDTDGPLTRAALQDGSIDVGLVLSSDGDLNSLGLVVLQDDKHLENADNVVPIVRQAAANDEVVKVLNGIDAKLTTSDLATLNSQVSIQNQDPLAVANAWLQQHNYWGPTPVASGARSGRP